MKKLLVFDFATILLLFATINTFTTITDARNNRKFKEKHDYTKYEESDSRYWYTMARSEIYERVNGVRPNTNVAKNVVIFLGDGMGISTITASRIYKGQMQNKPGEEGYMEFDRFPYSSLIKTYNIDRQVPDSAGTATAYLGGVKANFYTIGVNAKVAKDEPDCALVKNSSVSSVLMWAQEAGKGSGFVTTTRVTHATPAASYAHSQDRDWEAAVPEDGGERGHLKNPDSCKDIASQLIEDLPGSKLNVAMGGGRAMFLPEESFDPKGTRYQGKILPVPGKRTDGRNLIQEWLDNRRKESIDSTEYSYVNSTGTLQKVDLSKTKHLFGMFNHTNMEYEVLRDKTEDGEPSLTEMVEAAIKVLSNHENGFVLLVEGGRIDHAHHDGFANLAMTETVELDRAIRRARELLPMDETLVLVTADHSHSMTINGYPRRGNPISGLGGQDDLGVPYTTLMYANGPGYRSEAAREILHMEDLSAPKFRPYASIPIKETHHGGEDVAVFAVGPWAHLFGGTREQSFIAHVMAYASCIGQFQNEQHCQSDGASESVRASRKMKFLTDSDSGGISILHSHSSVLTLGSLIFAIFSSRIFF